MNSNNTTRTGKSLSLSEPVKYGISVLILLVGAGVLFALYQMRGSTKEKDSDALIPMVDTAPVENFVGDLDLLVSGTVVPFREITVGAEVGGKVLKKYPDCEAGNFVTKGTKLLEIDPQDYNLEIKTMESELVQADRTMGETEEEIRGAIKNLELAKSDFKLQRNEFRRFERLKDSLAANEYDQARRNLLNSQSQLTLRQNSYDMLLARKERLKASRELITNRKEKADVNLQRTIVTAPVDGVIVREAVEPGDFVSVGRELFVFEDTSRAEVRCNLTPGELAWIRKYAPENNEPRLKSQTADGSAAKTHNRVYQLPNIGVNVFDQSEPGVQWLGTLERFDGIGRDEATKSIPCRISVPNPVVDTSRGSRALVRGMFVKCRMVVPSESQTKQLAAFPSVAVRPGDYVWVVREDKLNRFELDVIDRSPVRESLGSPNMVVVSLDGSDMELGDQVVVSPLPQPTEGGRVILKDSEQSAARQPSPDGATLRASRAEDGSSQRKTRTSSSRGSGSDASEPSIERSQP